MIFKNLPYINDLKFKIRLLNSASLTMGPIDFFYKDKYELFQHNNLIKVELDNNKDEYELHNLLKGANVYLSEIIRIEKETTEIHIKCFNGKTDHMGEIEIGIDEKIEQSFKKVFNTPDIHSTLQYNLNFTHNNKSYFLITCGRAASKDNNNNNFTVIGNEYKIPISKKNINEKEIFIATKIITTDNNLNDKAIRLIEGNIKILDYTKTGQIKTEAIGLMAKYMDNEDTYLKKWDEYGEKEGELLLKESRDIGKITFKNFTLVDDNVKFMLTSKVPDLVKVGEQLEVTDAEPIYINNPDLTYKEYEATKIEEIQDKYKEETIEPSISSSLDINNSSNNTEKKSLNKNNENTTIHKDISYKNYHEHGTVVSMSSDTITLALNKIPQKKHTKNHFLISSIIGQDKQIERRLKARQSIIEGRSTNPQLGLIITAEDDSYSATKLPKSHKAITPFVKNKIFKHDPTEKQIKAIDRALNTPDIALIQGPPGTGKTTVITAIIERLNEIYDKTGDIKGKILVSGLQHDAVENILQRLSINSLPSIKFGERWGEDRFSETSVSRRISAWCDEIASNIRNKNPKIQQSEIDKQLCECFRLYHLQPSKVNAIELLDKIISIPIEKIKKNTITKAKNIKDLIIEAEIYNNSIKLQYIRALRITEDGFNDDGKKRATDVLVQCADDLDDKQTKILNICTSFNSDSTPDFLEDLKKLKKNLLEKYTPKPFYEINKPREDISILFKDVKEQLNNGTNNKENILLDFLKDLEENPYQIRESLSNYNIVYGATVQQSEGYDIRKAKNNLIKGEEIEYDYVIIDEAARTSPRDLLIPMVQGRKIILVGDHRQLPHMVNESIVKILEDENSNNNPNVIESDYIKNSMFRYLFNRIKEIQKRDDIKRIVTLDAQFRMHPLLGDFVSNQFYPKDEQFTSPLKKDFFECNLPIVNNASAIWIDVPPEKGIEKRNNTMSLNRMSEAIKISEILNAMINDKSTQNLSFGIISFYTSQVNTIKSELSKYKITEKDDDGKYIISKKYKKSLISDGDEEKLRINTVDSFQGMEFDIVILSAVRSKAKYQIDNKINKSKNIDITSRSIYGHLMSVNRLCVSMSRQIKKLIIVGDASLFTRDIAIEKVPGLYNFYKLCKDNKDGMIING